MSSISSFEFISAVVPEPAMFIYICIPVSAADTAAAVDPNGTKNLLANG